MKHWSRIAEKQGVEIEPITRRDLPRLAEFDALFIRETTSIDNHTYRFARRAVQEGMPVIDDPISMIRCTNKVFLMELLSQNQVATPPGVILTEDSDLTKAMDELGKPRPVPELLPESDIERMRFEEAGLRRRSRLAHADELKALRALRERPGTPS